MTTGMTGMPAGVPPGREGGAAARSTAAGSTAAPGAAAPTGGAQGHPAPTEVERELAAALAGGGQDAVLDVLARTRLYVLVPRLHADVPDWTAPLPTFRDAASRRICVPVLTPGLLPPWHPEWVFRAVDLGELARIWPYDARRLAVNHGTPLAAQVDAGPRRLKAWRSADARSGAAREGRLLTDATGPLHGPLAHGLALGAHLAVHNGLAWNRLGAVYQDYATDRARLRSPWGIQHRADLRRRLDSLMKCRLVGRVQETVLRSRHTLALRLGRTPTPAEWTEAVDRAFAARDAEDRTEAHGALHRVTRYEERFRADGALAPDGRIDTLAAFDLGRAVNVVRLALGARLTEPHEAEQDVLRLGELARQAYPSWAAFSLGYALARLVHGDDADGTPGEELRYQQSLAQHRILAQAPTSPYRNIPWS
ncbi:DUF1266 domain-containing protein [Streptomyces sp. V2I9]|uniref:DUF1266 domain-containing protein n=1 Tax=Streptomyces sp. V2I9 TaxID=3042304 RepID=UPI002784F19B|nr:DUF1266 domain-containing protein [Streptomyces sp. V2I9]MDQ0986951.1 hypothetical protein [Streptomyces sp. V2I9]